MPVTKAVIYTTVVSAECLVAFEVPAKETDRRRRFSFRPSGSEVLRLAPTTGSFPSPVAPRRPMERNGSVFGPSIFHSLPKWCARA